MGGPFTAEERHAAKYGQMRVIATDQFRGRLYECRCGVMRWSVWANAEKHAQSCPRASEPWETP